MKFANKPKLMSNKSKVICLSWDNIFNGVLKSIESLDASSFDEILVMARGGMVPAAIISHHTVKRDLSFYQGKRTASNTPHDYCEFVETGMSSKIKKGKRYLIVEDIIFKGVTIDGAIAKIKKGGSTLTGICSIVIDEKFDMSSSNYGVSLYVAFICPHLKWIRFPWEKRVKGEKELQLNEKDIRN
ncbi:MAG: phosphoribosyltransferase family protein [Patescibacteria group bacterium]|jgi:hypoxanthine phosphoribosyltransferase